MQNVFFVPSFTDGELSKKDLKEECQKEKWLPIMTVETPHGKIVPIFKDSISCLKFIKRNAPPNQVVLQVKMDIKDLKKFKDKGIEPEWHEFPKLYKNREGHSIKIDIIETDFTLKYF
ncbi:MAG: hypothetical protein EKK64_05505 [Neisseriaceae bacterium]|nr:MAG: hypothetical protein EKK64_05505 [Neisseriaceae bacterium]